MKKVITYGTFDLLHIGHVNLLRRAKEFGDYLVVGLSTDEFNAQKHKESILPYRERKAVLESLRYVDLVIAERTWEQKARDIRKHDIDTLVMGNDWKGHFDDLKKYCRVIYLPRTKHLSTTLLKARIERGGH